MRSLDFTKWLKSGLRRLSMRWPPISATRKYARVARGQYRCAGYGETGEHIVPRSIKGKINIFVDHVEPVGSSDDWDTHIHRLFCDEEGLQLLCKVCHDRKTRDENSRRTEEVS